MKIYKHDCIGRVPSSIKDLEKCEMCQNEEICTALWSGAQVETKAKTRLAVDQDKEEYSANATQHA